MLFRSTSFVLLLIACASCNDRCVEPCGQPYVAFVAIGYTKDQLDSATISTYDNNGTFSTGSFRGAFQMDSAWNYDVYSGLSGDTFFCNTYYKYDGIAYNLDYKITIPSTGDVFEISQVTFAGQFSVNDYCNEGGTPTGPQCTDPAHLTTYTVNGTGYSSTATSTSYPNVIYLIK